MNLAARFRVRRGDFLLEADVTASAGTTLAFVGPNGAGKTTCLDTLAGLIRIESGFVTLGGRTLDGGRTGAWLPPEARRVALVFQDQLLFPNLNALENVAFGLRSRGIRRRAAERIAATWLERVGAGALGAARPRALSGGEAQRVALARALATEPDLLLLDEPLAAVDASGKVALLATLRGLLADFAGVSILVTHAIEDALALTDRFVVFEAGRVVQTGSIDALVGRPSSRYVADLVGINHFHGTGRGGVVDVADGSLVVASEHEGAVILSLHPRAVALFRQRPEGSPRNVWQAPILGLEPSLERVRVRLGGALPLVAEVTPAAVRDLELRAGETIWVAIKATEITVAPG